MICATPECVGGVYDASGAGAVDGACEMGLVTDVVMAELDEGTEDDEGADDAGVGTVGGVGSM